MGEPCVRSVFVKICLFGMKRGKQTVGVLTHPLRGNYGGMLQAYALCRTVERLGCKAYLVGVKPDNDRDAEDEGVDGLWSTAVRLVKDVAGYVLIRAGVAKSGFSIIRRMVRMQARWFQRRFLPAEIDFTDKRIGRLSRFVVGSDQVWRASYIRPMTELGVFFLDFADERQRRGSISYAASFGTGVWEGTPEETRYCKGLVRELKAVSVREDSGVRICRDVFDVEAVAMPDPTFLVPTGDYERIIHAGRTHLRPDPYFVSYILDGSEEVEAMLEDLASGLSLRRQGVRPCVGSPFYWERFSCSVAQWLRYMRDAEAVVTDSFHGCVFAIIYHKPFVCLGNESRGSTRFESLLRTYGLEDRRVARVEAREVQRVLQMPIDWACVDSVLDAERRRGFDFLRQNLYDEI